MRKHFTEAFLYLPYSYQVNSQADEGQVVGSGPSTIPASSVWRSEVCID